MTVIALLETPNGFREDNGLLGWIDCAEGTLVCDRSGKLFSIALLNAWFAIIFPIRAYDVIATPSNADLIAFLLAAMFSGIALRLIYLAAKALLVKRVLAAVRDFIEPITEFRDSNMAERDASPQRGSRASP